jgi:predicted flap endonuclease-1-like 5' DNA nuclease
MAKAIEDIEGIGPSYGEKLRSAGVKTAAALLEAGDRTQ